MRQRACWYKFIQVWSSILLPSLKLGQCIAPKRRYISTRLQDSSFQKNETIKTAVMWTSNPFLYSFSKLVYIYIFETSSKYSDFFDINHAIIFIMWYLFFKFRLWISKLCCYIIEYQNSFGDLVTVEMRFPSVLDFSTLEDETTSFPRNE